MSDNISDPIAQFQKEREERIASYKHNTELLNKSRIFCLEAVKNNYTFNFSWLGRPIIQIPQDLMAMQEIIWDVKPDYIIETGVAHGGSLIFYASMLELTGNGKVIGIDIEIRSHNRREVENHPMYHRIELIEGSSIDDNIAQEIKNKISVSSKVLVVLDSNHTHAHVLRELELYAPLVSPGSYCIVFDTGIEDLPRDMIVDRAWGPGNNPKTAVWEFLKHNDQFVIDKEIESKILITAAPDGYLKRIK